VPKLRFSAEWAQRLLEQALAGVSGDVGVAVIDLGTGAFTGVNPDMAFTAASVAKVPIAMAALNLVSTGRLTLEEPVVYRSATDYEGGAGSLQFSIREGEAIPVGYLLDRMIVVSDNIARNMLERYIGSDTIRQYMLSLGVQPPYAASNPQMTARGAVQLLTLLDSGQAGITPELTHRLIGWLSATVFNDRIPARLPPSVTVAHKVGTLANEVHDAGLVYAPDRSFAIAVFTQNIPENRAADLIARLAATMYGYEDWLVAAGG